MSPKKEVDWDLVEADYRAGVKTLRQIAEEHGVTHGAVNKRAKTRGWSRDLAPKIKAKADEKVSRLAVSKEVSTERLATEQQVVEANAEIQASVRMEHREDIRRSRMLFRSMLRDLEIASDDEGRDLIERMQEVLEPPVENESPEAAARRVDRMRKRLNELFNLPGRIDSGKKLSEMLERLIKLERQAHGIEDKDGPGRSQLDELLAKVLSS